jgi:hypothetical protein
MDIIPEGAETKKVDVSQALLDSFRKKGPLNVKKLVVDAFLSLNIDQNESIAPITILQKDNFKYVGQIDSDKGIL